MKLVKLETRNFEFMALGDTQSQAVDLLRTACHAHSLEYKCDFQYFLDLIGDDENTDGNMVIVDIECGRAYRDNDEIVR